MTKANLAAFPTLPFVGRDRELDRLERLTRQVADGTSVVSLLCGPSGIGKSLLVSELESIVGGKGFQIMRGAAFPVDYGVPFALWAEAALPLLNKMDPSTRTTLSRGRDDVLGAMFPSLAGGVELTGEGVPGELQGRIQWVFGDLLRALAGREPLIVILEDLHWAGRADLDLLHFCLRQVRDAPVGWFCTYNSETAPGLPGFKDARQWLHDLAGDEITRLGPLASAEVSELIARGFGVTGELSESFSAWLHDRTGGNPFFVEEVLKSLSASGTLRERDGTWVGWEARPTDVPESIGGAIAGRLRHLSKNSADVASVVAVASPRATFGVLTRTSDLPEAVILTALDELRAYGFLVEEERDGDVIYGFSHPMVREVTYDALGVTRQRVMHRRVGQALRELYGDASEDRVEELAHHYALALGGDFDPHALEMLVRAGRKAFRRRDGPEAVRLLEAARERLGRVDRAQRVQWVWTHDLDELLGQAHARTGDLDGAERRLRDALKEAGELGEKDRVARVRRRLGQVAYWRGDHEEALNEYRAGERVAREHGLTASEAHLKQLAGVSLQALGDEEGAREELNAARELAEQCGDPAVLGRVHRGLMILNVWSGHLKEVREHGTKAIELAEQSGDVHLAYWSHWILAVSYALIGETPVMDEHIRECRRIADDLRSPILRLWTSELSIEHAAASGDWERGIMVGEAAVSRARDFNQPVLLARVSIWLSLIYFGRGDLERGKELVDQAAALAGRGGAAHDIHTIVPTYIGRVAYHVALEEYERAVEVGEEGLAIAENSGYVIWAVHRLFPYVMEAYLWSEKLDAARQVADRMRSFTDRLEHKLGKAWLQAFGALEAWKSGDIERSVELLEQSAVALEAVPMLYDAARIRRILAGRLADLGRRDEALVQLRIAHDALAGMGARKELKKARAMFKELDARAPVLASEPGAGGLTGREAEIARLAADGKSNKGIARELGVSPRTVSTHLSNIFLKLELASRGELGALVRDRPELFTD